MKETKDTAENNEDERWRMIISKADQAALNAFIGISFISFFFQLFQEGSVIRSLDFHGKY